MENKYVKTFEQFSEELLNNPENIENLDEGLKDWLKGVNWKKKNWKIAYGYYKLMGQNNANAEKIARNIAVKGTIEDKNDWPASTSKYGDKAKQFELFRDGIDRVQRGVSGVMSIDPGGHTDSVAQNPQMKKAAEMFKKDPTIWDKEIEQIVKEEGVE